MKDTHFLAAKSAADKAKRLRLLTAAWFNKNEMTLGNMNLALMEKMLTEQKAGKTEAGDKAEAKAKKEKKKATEVRKARTAAEKPFNTAISALNRAIAEAKVHRALAEGKKDEAKSFLAKASDIRGDRKALMLFRVGDAEAALKSAAAAVKSGAEQARPLAVQAYLLHAAGKKDEAKKAFQKKQKRKSIK